MVQAAPPRSPSATMTRERLQVETAEKGLLAISALVLAVLFVLPAIGALGDLGRGSLGVITLLYPVALVAGLAGAVYFGLAYRRLKKRL